MNLRPLGYEPNELPDCSTPRQPTDRNTPCECAQGSHRGRRPGKIQQQLDSRGLVIRKASTTRRTNDPRSRRLDRVPVLPGHLRSEIPQLFTSHGHRDGVRQIAIVRLGDESRREARRLQADALDVGQPAHDRHSRRYRGTHDLILVDLINHVSRSNLVLHGRFRPRQRSGHYGFQQYSPIVSGRRSENPLFNRTGDAQDGSAPQLRTPASRFQCGASAPGIAAHTSGTGRA